LGGLEAKKDKGDRQKDKKTPPGMQSLFGCPGKLKYSTFWIRLRQKKTKGTSKNNKGDRQKRKKAF